MNPQSLISKPAAKSSSVDKALRLLEFLAASTVSVSLQEAAEAVQLPKPTAYRLLRTLQKRGYVTRPASSKRYISNIRISRL